MKSQLIYPMAYFVFFSGGLIFYNLFRRLSEVKRGAVKAKYFKTYSDKSLVPEQLIVLERHFDNQFQLPMLFIATALAAMVLDTVSSMTIGLAWAFVISRMLHTWIHLRSNHVLKRAGAYALGWLCVWLLWLELIWVNAMRVS